MSKSNDKDKVIVEYKGKTFKTINYKPMSDEEFEELRNEFYSKPSYKEVRENVREIMAKGNIMQSVIRNYFFRDLQAKTKLYHCNWTVEDAFTYKPILEIFNAKITKNPKVFINDTKLPNILRSMKLGGSGICSLPSSFKISVTKEILNKYSVNKNYYDSSCGWGIRMMGSLATGHNYFGTDPNYKLTERLDELSGLFREVDLFTPSVDIRTQGSEIFVPEWEGKMGVSMTSPPYFFLEDYQVGEQSTKKYPKYEDWCNKYLLRTFKNIYRYLVDGAHLLWNIKDYKEFDLVAKTIEKAEEAGFKYIGVEGNIVYGDRPKNNGERNDTSEGMFIFRKGDNIHNIDYEAKINASIKDNLDDDDEEIIEEEEEEKENIIDEKNEEEPMENNIEYNDLFSTEQVSKYHPDKYADQISDAVLYFALKKNPNARCAIETLVKGGVVVVAGEINGLEIHTNDIRRIVNNVANHLGYEVTNVIDIVKTQSSEIHNAVDKSPDNIGAGDQGMVYGFATRETDSYLPFGFDLANKIIKRLEDSVEEGILKGDAKTQVTINKKTNEIHNVLISACHSNELKEAKQYITELLKDLVDADKLIINPAGSWKTGGPEADAGLTGRKIVADQYGGYCAVGGGAFSGKDLTKVDRSGAYTARNIAVDIIDKFEEISKVEIQIGYGISIEEPLSISIRTNKPKMKNELLKFIHENYDLTPNGMIKALSLKPKDFIRLSQGCHYRFGKVESKG